MANKGFVPEEMRAYFKENYKKDDKDSLEQILLTFREKKYSTFAALILLVEEVGLSMAEANQIITNSRSLNLDE